MQNKQDNRTILKGCLSTLAVMVPWYFFTPWQIATTLAITSLLIYYLIGVIIHEFKKSQLKKRTSRVVISNAPKFGYVKLIASVEDPAGVDTWFTNESADYHWLAFQHQISTESVSSDGTTSRDTDWRSFHEDESAMKTLKVKDGTGSCWVGLHHIHFSIKQKIKTYKAEELMATLQAKEYPDALLDQVKASGTVRIIEKWIPKDHPITFYGTFNRLSLDAMPSDIIKAATKSRKLGVVNDEMHRDPARQMDTSDWQQLMDQAKAAGRSTLDILTADYSGNEEKEITMSLKDRTGPNFGAIALYLVFILFILFFAYGFLNSQFPEFIEEMWWLLES